MKFVDEHFWSQSLVQTTPSLPFLLILHHPSFPEKYQHFCSRGHHSCCCCPRICEGLRMRSTRVPVSLCYWLLTMLLDACKESATSSRMLPSCPQILVSNQAVWGKKRWNAFVFLVCGSWPSLRGPDLLSPQPQPHEDLRVSGQMVNITLRSIILPIFLVHFQVEYWGRNSVAQAALLSFLYQQN